MPGPGEVRVRVQAIALNLNDLERISGGNMMVEPELPAEPAPAAPAGPAPSPYGGPMPGMSATPPAAGAFSGFTLPPSPFLMLRNDPAAGEAAPEQGPAQS